MQRTKKVSFSPDHAIYTLWLSGLLLHKLELQRDLKGPLGQVYNFCGPETIIRIARLILPDKYRGIYIFSYCDD